MYCSQNIYLFVYLFNDVNNTHIYIYVSVTHGSEKPTTRVAHGGFVCNCMSRAKLFMNPLIEGPGTIFGW